MENLKFGEFFKKQRQKLGFSLREFCLNNSLDPGNISKLERGRLNPPSRRILEEYAKCLEIQEGSDDWYIFFDLSSAASGKIPDDLMEDEQFVQNLPVFFRTLRGKKPNNDQLRTLIEIIRKA